MRSPLGTVYCQRCRAANSVADESCARCGTRLMLVFEPTNLRFEETEQASGTLDEHLLERISLLENNLSRVIDKVEKTLDLMLKQAQSSYTSHSLLDTLISTLAETGALDRGLLQARWREREGPRAAGHAAGPGARRADPRVRVTDDRLAGDGGSFAVEVEEGVGLLERGRVTAGIKELERAASAAGAGARSADELIGRALISAGRPSRALAYLRRAAEFDPDDAAVCSLLGLALGETGNLEGGEDMLRLAVERGVSNFTVHFALGRLAAARGSWRAALAEFKNALACRECPAGLYHLGLAHYRLGHLRAAESVLARAVALDPGYANARDLLARLRSAPADGVTRGLRQSRDEKNGRQPDASGRRIVTGGEARILCEIKADLLGEALSR